MIKYRNGDIWGFENGGHVGCSSSYSDSESGVILGVDGGTTSTICVCIPFSSLHSLPDPSLPILARAVAGCSNHNSVGETAARDTLEQVMAETLLNSGSKRSAVRAVCLGVSGVNHPTDQERILKWLRDIFPSHVKLYVHNDAVAALASGTLGKLHGCVLIAGTGCIACGFAEDGQEARAAGAGPILGDWGRLDLHGLPGMSCPLNFPGEDILVIKIQHSMYHIDNNSGSVLDCSLFITVFSLGYGIAAQALTAVIRAHDGRGPQTMLTKSVLQSLSLSSPDELIGWTYADPSWARIAALVPVVVSCAEDGDQIANKILEDAVQELAVSVKAVVRRLCLGGVDGNGSFPVVMVGGVLEANRKWDIGKEVIDCIQKTYPKACPVKPKVEPAVGAALFAWNLLKKETEVNCHR
ncbi:hypothetical protein TEA_006727 [Camellia sinensis var. sinensis]|uniref:N-acetyl-D-glucosamine kinase n=1 Tax=Camellia sinensis var. sinensis TaxID=542762 RepID=A0A4S4D7R0_CAMSN|nr:hypothetical protein TEA_006727 [Camellia sinensis var. sinensis]